MIKLGIDASSGDRTDKKGNPVEIADIWINAALNELKNKPDLEVLLVGEPKPLEESKRLFEEHGVLQRVSYIQTDSYFDMRGKVVGRKSQTSYIQLLNHLKEESLDAVISGGNTKVLVRNALRLGQLSFYDNIPPLTTEIPTITGQNALLLDIGATNKHDTDLLVDFAKIGLAYATAILGRERPRIGLLSNGTEPDKGTLFIQDAAEKLSAKFGKEVFVGQIDPSGENSYFAGNIDIFLAPDGVTGNLVLKTMEATAKFYGQLLKEIIGKEGIGVIQRSKRLAGYLLLADAFDELKSIMDPNKYNGTAFMGYNKPVFKSHGGSSILSMEGAIKNAYVFLKQDRFQRFNQELQKHYLKH